jgi:hypothetical protein
LPGSRRWGYSCSRAAGKERPPQSPFTHLCTLPACRVSYESMGDFYSGLKSALGRRMLWEVVLGVRRNDLLGLAGQLAYFFLLFFFPFLIFLVSLTGLVIGNPEAGLKSLGSGTWAEHPYGHNLR